MMASVQQMQSQTEPPKPEEEKEEAAKGLLEEAAFTVACLGERPKKPQPSGMNTYTLLLEEERKEDPIHEQPYEETLDGWLFGGDEIASQIARRSFDPCLPFIKTANGLTLGVPFSIRHQDCHIAPRASCMMTSVTRASRAAVPLPICNGSFCTHLARSKATRIHSPSLPRGEVDLHPIMEGNGIKCKASGAVITYVDNGQMRTSNIGLPLHIQLTNGTQAQRLYPYQKKSTICSSGNRFRAHKVRVSCDCGMHFLELLKSPRDRRYKRSIVLAFDRSEQRLTVILHFSGNRAEKGRHIRRLRQRMLEVQWFGSWSLFRAQAGLLLPVALIPVDSAGDDFV